MKIGILTFHKPINYGAFLQAFSLSSKLIKQGFDAEIVDYVPPLENRKIYINALWILKHYGFKGFCREIQKISTFKKSQKYLVKSHAKFVTNYLNKLYKYIDKTYDVLIIGSDAVFNWTQNGFPSAFLPDYSFTHCKICSYAASVHGLRYLTEHSQSPSVLRRIFNQFCVIGVRDYQTEKFVSYYNVSCSPIHCCDPTFFIDIPDVISNASNFKERIMSKYNLCLDEDYIVVMLPDDNLNKAICDKYSGCYKTVSLFNPSKSSDYFLYDLNPFEWVAVLSCAKGVITSYFHGTLLSLKVNTPTVTVDYSHYDSPYESKLYDLYHRRLNIPELYYLSSSPIQSILNRFDEAIQGCYRYRISKSYEKEISVFDSFLERLKLL